MALAHGDVCWAKMEVCPKRRLVIRALNATQGYRWWPATVVDENASGVPRLPPPESDGESRLLCFCATHDHARST